MATLLAASPDEPERRNELPRPGMPGMTWKRRKPNKRSTCGSRTGTVRVAGLSIFDPVHLGITETGAPLLVELAYHNLLVAGEPGAGKSVLLQNILGHASQCADVQLWLFDGKRLELGMWAEAADVFVGPNLTQAIHALHYLQEEIDRRTDVMLKAGIRKIEPQHQADMILAILDELAFYTATIGDPKQRDEFTITLRDVVARGRSVGIIVVAATQRPSADIIPTSLRDIFGYRCAFRCTTDVSSDIVLGFGWASQGYSSFKIAPEDRGVGWLLAEGGTPIRFRSAFLSDDQIRYLVARSLEIRRPHPHSSASQSDRRTDGGAA
jgi:S-DNA-T family DNA segregation ATPase FtsK/SpoIIIE